MSEQVDAGINTPAKGLTLDEAFAQLKASRSQDPTVDTLEDEDAEVVEEDELEDEFDSDTDDLEDDEDDSDGDDQDEESEDGDEGEGEGEDDVWEIELDGEMVEVTAEELRKGYLRNNDYTRKRQADAKKAKDLEAEYTGKIGQLNKALEQNVSQEQKQLVSLTNQYKQETDAGKQRDLHYRILQLQQSIGNRQKAMQQASALQQQTAQATAEAHWQEQEEMLRTQYEDWDTKKDELKGYLESQGFEDMSMFAHANMAMLVDKAKQFDELQQKRNSTVKKKLRKKVPKVLRAGKGEKQFSVDARKVQDLEARFAKTGSIKDAQALMRAKRGK